VLSVCGAPAFGAEVVVAVVVTVHYEFAIGVCGCFMVSCRRGVRRPLANQRSEEEKKEEKKEEPAPAPAPVEKKALQPPGKAILPPGPAKPKGASLRSLSRCCCESVFKEPRCFHVHCILDNLSFLAVEDPAPPPLPAKPKGE
jgi:hypothetical protein